MLGGRCARALASLVQARVRWGGLSCVEGEEKSLEGSVGDGGTSYKARPLVVLYPMGVDDPTRGQRAVLKDVAPKEGDMFHGRS